VEKTLPFTTHTVFHIFPVSLLTLELTNSPAQARLHQVPYEGQKKVLHIE